MISRPGTLLEIPSVEGDTGLNIDAGEDGRGDTLPSDFELEGVNGLLMPFFLPFCFDRKDDRDATLVGVLDTETGVREGVPGESEADDGSWINSARSRSPRLSTPVDGVLTELVEVPLGLVGENAVPEASDGSERLVEALEGSE
jgi:hypothetical protein